MQKILALLFTLYLVLPNGWAGPVEISSTEEDNTLQVDEKAAGERPKPLHEVVHVHHVPVQIPVYASMMVHESQHHQQAHHPQHQNSHASSGHYPFYPVEREAQSCAAPNNAGIKRLFREASDLLPMNKISEIVKRAVKYDPQMREFRKIFYSQETLNKLLSLRAKSQFVELENFACKRLFLNMRKFFKFLSCMIASEEPEVALESAEHQLVAEDFTGRPGLRGLIKDIYEILPHEELQQLYKRLKDSDRYLRYSVRQIKSPEFQELMQNLREVREYQDLKKMLKDAGLPIEAYNKLLIALWGWEDDISADVLQI